MCCLVNSLLHIYLPYCNMLVGYQADVKVVVYISVPQQVKRAGGGCKQYFNKSREQVVGVNSTLTSQESRWWV